MRGFLTILTMLIGVSGAYAQDKPFFEHYSPSNGEKVLGGVATPAQSWPGIASLQVVDMDSKVHNCGATAISQYWLLTAAHCVDDLRRHENGEWHYYGASKIPGFPPEDYGKMIAVIGEAYLGDTDTGSEYEISEIHYYRGYTSDRVYLGNDIGLIKLSRPYTGPVMRLSLSDETDDFSETGDFVRVAGYGRTGLNSLDETEPHPLQSSMQTIAGSLTLLETEMPTLKQAACSGGMRQTLLDLGGSNEMITGALDFVVDDRVICAGAAKRNACHGDSGGPLVKYDAYRHPYQIGLVSWGVRCGLPGAPSIYTRVSAFKDWIVKTAGPEILATAQKAEDLPIDASIITFIDDVIGQYPTVIAPLEIELIRNGEPFSDLGPDEYPDFELGDIVDIRVNPPVTGKLYLLDLNSLGQLNQIYPTERDAMRTDGWPTYKKNEVFEFPKGEFTFDIVMQPPTGLQTAIALIVPEDSALIEPEDGNPPRLLASRNQLASDGSIEAPSAYILRLLERVYEQFSFEYGMARFNHYQSPDYPAGQGGLSESDIGTGAGEPPKSDVPAPPNSPRFGLGYVRYEIRAREALSGQ